MNNILNTQFIGFDLFPPRPPVLIVFKCLKAFMPAQKDTGKDVSGLPSSLLCADHVTVKYSCVHSFDQNF